MDAGWIKEYADLFMLGAGASAAFVWSVFKAVDWYNRKFRERGVNGNGGEPIPKGRDAVTKEDIGGIHRALDSHAERTNERFNEVHKCLAGKFEEVKKEVEDTSNDLKKSINETKSNVLRVGDRTGRLESRVRSAEKDIKTHSSHIARMQGSIETNRVNRHG